MWTVQILLQAEYWLKEQFGPLVLFWGVFGNKLGLHIKLCLIIELNLKVKHFDCSSINRDQGHILFCLKNIDKNLNHKILLDSHILKTFLCNRDCIRIAFRILLELKSIFLFHIKSLNQEYGFFFYHSNKDTYFKLNREVYICSDWQWCFLIENSEYYLIFLFCCKRFFGEALEFPLLNQILLLI